MNMARVLALSFCLAAAEVVAREASRSVQLTPVHSNDPGDPNRSFAVATPKAAFEFTVTNADAFDFLEPGAKYDIVMVRQDSGATISVAAPIGASVAGTSENGGLGVLIAPEPGPTPASDEIAGDPPAAPSAPVTPATDPADPDSAADPAPATPPSDPAPAAPAGDGTAPQA